MPRRSARNKQKKQTNDEALMAANRKAQDLANNLEEEDRKITKFTSPCVMDKAPTKRTALKRTSAALPTRSKRSRKEAKMDKVSAKQKRAEKTEKLKANKIILAKEKAEKSKARIEKEKTRVAQKVIEDCQTYWTDSDITASAARLQANAGTKKWEWDWDRCGVAMGHQTSVNAGFGTEIPTATRNIILVRHGQYSSSLPNDADRILTEIGKKQSILTGKRLSAVIPRVTSVSHSTMKRAEQTAELIVDQLSTLDEKMLGCDLIREGAPVPPTPESQAYRPNERQIHEDAIRIEAAFRKYFHRASIQQTEDTHDVVVCHANVIRYFLCRALQMPLNGWIRLSLTNASITWIAIEPTGRVWLRQMGDGAYMPKNILTFN